MVPVHREAADVVQFNLISTKNDKLGGGVGLVIDCSFLGWYWCLLWTRC